MGGLFSAPKTPAIKLPKPQQVKVPTPEETVLPGPDDFGSAEAARRARLAALSRRGRASTVLTGPNVVPSVPALSYVNTLLGE